MNVGLLSVTESVIFNSKSLQAILAACSGIVSSRLYVVLHRDSPRVSAGNKNTLFSGISALYTHSFTLKPELDVRVLLSHLKNSTTSFDLDDRIYQKELGDLRFDVLITDSTSTSPSWIRPPNTVQVSGNPEFPAETKPNGQIGESESWETYRNVVIGGTFDHLHAGHKILLTSAIMRCTEKLTIGITVQEMLKKKLLADLIQPIETREHALRKFCEQVDPSINYNIVPITDPFGPSIVDPDLEAVVASQETVDGANAINVERKKKRLSQLKVHIFPLHDVAGNAETLRKISSSWTRQQLLGKLIKPPEPRPHLPKKPYLIGLTGGSGSGKSNIGRYLASKPGTLVIDCDKIAHEAYQKGSVLYDTLVAEYGSDILDILTGEIDRRNLGKLVFGNEEARQKLNSLVWPEVMNYCFSKVNAAKPEVAFFDAALLIEAGWGSYLHEVWVTFVPEDEALKRIMERDKIEEQAAIARISTQLSNRERIRHANVLFCSLWDYSVTQAQVDHAWTELFERL